MLTYHVREPQKKSPEVIGLFDLYMQETWLQGESNRYVEQPWTIDRLEQIPLGQLALMGSWQNTSVNPGMNSKMD